MKISIALFTAPLIAASHNLLASAADAAADAATSRPHLRALADAAVDVGCPNNTCNTISDNTNQCATGYRCMSLRTADGSSNGCDGTCVRVVCGQHECDANQNGCPSDSSCDTSMEGSVQGYCFQCVVYDNEPAPQPPQNDEDGKEATSLRTSILEEE
jgi:hypothetical protein